MVPNRHYPLHDTNAAGYGDIVRRWNEWRRGVSDLKCYQANMRQPVKESAQKAPA